jgi:lipoprotein-anchoring transpeptidase ErfK/SrfK
MPRAFVLKLAAVGVLAASSAIAGPVAPTTSYQQNPTVIGAPPEAAQAEPRARGDMGGGFLQVLFERRDDHYIPVPPAPRYYRPSAPTYRAPAATYYRPAPTYYRPAAPSYYAPAARYARPAPPETVVIAPSDDAPYQHYYVPPRIERPRYVPRASYPSPAQKQPDARFQKTVVPYDGKEEPGTVVIDTNTRYLYLVQDDGTAIRYGVGVGRPGFEWKGTHSVTAKREWPEWHPPAEMRARQPHLPVKMEGGPENPLGARALYLGSTLYRIHGSNEPQTIGQAVSSGCFRMTNDDVVDLYERVPVGAKVIVL